MRKIKSVFRALGAWACSLLAAMLGSLIVLVLYYIVGMGKIATIVFCGIYFLALFLSGYGGMRLGFRLQRVKIQLPEKAGFRTALCAVLIFAIALGGQALFMLSYKASVTTVTADSVDVVLLLDASSSMSSYGYDDQRAEAATQFVESLDEDTQLAVVTYGSTVISGSTTDLMAMTDENKQTVSDVISAIDSVGGTDYTAALEEALAILSGSNAREDSAKAIILLTDGESGDLSSSIVNSVLNSGAILFTVRITSGSTSSEIQELISLAEDTGGTDTALDPSDVDTSEVLEAFENAFAAAANTTPGGVYLYGTLMFLYANTVWQFVIRTLSMMICALLFGIGYYGTFSKKTLLVNLIAGLAASILSLIVYRVAAATTWVYVNGLVVMPLLIASVWPSLNFETGDEFNV